MCAGKPDSYACMNRMRRYARSYAQICTQISNQHKIFPAQIHNQPCKLPMISLHRHSLRTDMQL